MEKKGIFFFIFTGKIKSFKQTRVSCTISKKIKGCTVSRECFPKQTPKKEQKSLMNGK